MFSNLKMNLDMKILLGNEFIKNSDLDIYIDDELYDNIEVSILEKNENDLESKKEDHKKIGEEGLEEVSDEENSFLKKNNLNESPSLNNSLNNSNEKKN